MLSGSEETAGWAALFHFISGDDHLKKLFKSSYREESQPDFCFLSWQLLSSCSY